MIYSAHSAFIHIYKHHVSLTGTEQNATQTLYTYIVHTSTLLELPARTIPERLHSRGYLRMDSMCNGFALCMYFVPCAV